MEGGRAYAARCGVDALRRGLGPWAVMCLFRIGGFLGGDQCYG
jgi:hypothetical protein